ncbi:hypothetical protein [Streptomyces canarius]|uniref:Uncharacterized protein n=1 Tax=Streptomyces canarius TaxID=285453 RepID=A0ABQ3CW43_9ACTN|nr:hypothetical protein GCM10010345_59070 [Streptomyces canarius]
MTDGRLTVDVSGLAGVADVSWPATCTPDDAGTVVVSSFAFGPNGKNNSATVVVNPSV